jgi:RHS repeat-associated protein
MVGVYSPFSYEKEIDGDDNVTNIDYIYTPTGLTLIVKNGTQYYTHTDLLGSIERITNSTGAMVSEYAYTPWGGRILLSGVNITDRGYTGHEHLSPFGDDTNSGFCLINMNGRIYDPVLARFLSPDPYVQAPDFTQSFNRYAYGWNNPFKYTDPSGYWWGGDDLLVAGVGFAIGYLSHGISTGNWGWSAVAAGGIGALMGWIGYNTAGLATGNYIGSMAINSVANQIMPSMNIPISQNFSIGISPAIGLGANGLNGGISMNAAYQKQYQDGNSFGISLGLSAASNYVGGGIGARYNDVGAFYGLTKYGNAYSVDGQSMNQWVGAFGFNIGKFSFQIQNDFLAFGSKNPINRKVHDRWRTGAYEFGWAFSKDLSLSLGTNIITNDPGSVRDAEIDYTGNNLHTNKITGKKYGSWTNGKVYTSPVYLGLKHGNMVSRLGYSFPQAQNFSQNELVHRNGFLGLPFFGYQNFYKNYSEFNHGFYSYYGGYQSHSLWGY